MPVVTNRGVDLRYEAADADAAVESEARSTVAFVNPVGYGAWVWGWQHAALAGTYDTLVWDLPGTGESGPVDDPLTVRDLVGHFEAVLADCAVANAHVVGAGLGGMVALEHARRYDRVDSLALFGTTADGGRVDADALDSLFAPPDDPAGLRGSLGGAFAADPADHPEVVADIVDWRAAEDADREGFAAQAAAMTGYAADPLYEVTVPARVFHGVDDAVVPADAGRDLAADLPRGEFRAVEGGHLCFVEESAAVNDALVGFLDEFE
ncbi:MAG: alpha/beta fold hydrolase [Haloarculaceae archaeon]